MGTGRCIRFPVVKARMASTQEKGDLCYRNNGYFWIPQFVRTCKKWSPEARSQPREEDVSLSGAMA